MTPVVEITDLQNNTGATASISDTDGSAWNGVYILPWRRTVLRGTWSLVGHRTGDGTLALSLEEGIYFAQLRSVLGDNTQVSEIVQFTVTDGLKPIHYRCCQAVRDILLGLSLEGIGEANTKILKHPNRFVDQIGKAGGAVISPVMELRNRHDSRRDELGYTVQVALMLPSNQRLFEGLETDLDWRERLTNALSQTLLPGVPEIHTVDCLPGPILLPDAFGAQWDVSVQSFRCYTAVVNAIYPPSV